ncbi:hypothetical protein HanRHA438_Chr17g0789801 [Helianthus annuus]|nr:hypothetical protein HanRHA438_Chr17g0789801 [Helianthus annuus]KAJ0842077.1 hypothetical protein HanPSC8_Chr14g0637581 [Helianthus annuus]
MLPNYSSNNPVGIWNFSSVYGLDMFEAKVRGEFGIGLNIQILDDVKLDVFILHEFGQDRDS